MTLSDTDRNNDLPSEGTVRELLGTIAPGSTVVAIGSLPGNFSNYTHLVEAQAANGSVFRIVIRRYAVFGNYDRGEKARREFKTLELLQRNGIPAPPPLYLDETGAVLGIPGIVTGYVPGEHIASPCDPMSWAGSLAMMLAKIHRVPCGAATENFLLDANAEASWFLRSGSVPDYVKVHPDGVAV
jgi:aminoglycoside phosphotransferase (APT) family kinase protein